MERRTATNNFCPHQFKLGGQAKLDFAGMDKCFAADVLQDAPRTFFAVATTEKGASAIHSQSARSYGDASFLRNFNSREPVRKQSKLISGNLSVFGTRQQVRPAVPWKTVRRMRGIAIRRKIRA